jgi:ribosomal-protein-alanine N-acetyltransferase
VAAFLDPDIQRWNMRRIERDEEAREWIGSWSARWESETDASWAMTRPDLAQALGYVALRSIDLEFGYGEITYWVCQGFRNQGLATGAARLVGEWALTDIGLHRIEIRHSTENGASCAVARQAGFDLEATLRSALLHADGWHDMHVHARVGRA